MPTIPIGGSFYKDESLPISAQDCINLYANIPQVATPSKKTLLPPAGISLAAQAGEGVFNRGAHSFKGIPYFVQGDELYRIDQNIGGGGTITYSSVQVSGATVITGTSRVLMADNGSDGDQMVIIDPDSDDQFNAWIYDESSLTPISDPDFDGPVSSVQYVDGYFLFTKKNGQKYFISELRDGTSYLATDFANAEASPDPLVSSFILNNEPVLLGTETLQVVQNQGGAGFPFRAVPGATQRKGLSSRYAIAEVNDMMVFLGKGVAETPSVWITDGGRPEKLSTIPIDNEISKYSELVIQNSFAWKYAQGGAQFVGFHFPGRDCFVYDFTSGEWHRRLSVNPAEEEVPYRVTSTVEAYGVVLVGDLISPNIGILDREVYDEFSHGWLPRRFVTPHIDNEGQPFFIDSIELVCETGVGLPSGQGSNPLVSLAVSRDGGRTFDDNTEREIGMGQVGEYDKRVIWNAQGRVAREACFRFEMSDPVKFAVQKVEANFD